MRPLSTKRRQAQSVRARGAHAYRAEMISLPEVYKIERHVTDFLFDILGYDIIPNVFLYHGFYSWNSFAVFYWNISQKYPDILESPEFSLILSNAKKTIRNSEAKFSDLERGICTIYHRKSPSLIRGFHSRVAYAVPKLVKNGESIVGEKLPTTEVGEGIIITRMPSTYLRGNAYSVKFPSVLKYRFEPELGLKPDGPIYVSYSFLRNFQTSLQNSRYSSRKYSAWDDGPVLRPENEYIDDGDYYFFNEDDYPDVAKWDGDNYVYQSKYISLFLRDSWGYFHRYSSCDEDPKLIVHDGLIHRPEYPVKEPLDVAHKNYVPSPKIHKELGLKKGPIFAYPELGTVKSHYTFDDHFALFNLGPGGIRSGDVKRTMKSNAVGNIVEIKYGQLDMPRDSQLTFSEARKLSELHHTFYVHHMNDDWVAVWIHPDFKITETTYPILKRHLELAGFG